MKKLFCLFLACAILLTFNVFASADSDLETALADTQVEVPEFDIATGEKNVLDRASIGATTDKVTLKDDEIIVKTEDGICFSYKYPEGNVIAISQDMQQQAYLYLILFSQNVTATCQSFIDRGMHLNIFDLDTGTDIYLYGQTTTISTIVQNLASLKEEDVLFIESLIKNNYFDDAKSVTTGMIGNNLWIFADYGTGGWLVTYVNGVEVNCIFKYVDDHGAETGLRLLETLSITAA